MKKIFIAFIAFAAIIWASWIVVPAASIQFIIEDSIHDTTMNVETVGLKKGLFYTFDVEKVIVKSSGKELLTLGSVRSRINPLSLMMLKLNLTINGEFGGGDISGDVKLSKNATIIRLNVKQAGIDKMLLLQRIGIQGTGTVSGRFTLLNNSGNIAFATDNVRFEPAPFSGIKVPLNFFHRATGSLIVKDNILNVVSVSFEGKDIFARLKGRIQNFLMDLTMELMPGKTFVENPLFLADFQRYRVSPGYYVIPMRGNLSL